MDVQEIVSEEDEDQGMNNDMQQEELLGGAEVSGEADAPDDNEEIQEENKTTDGEEITPEDKERDLATTEMLQEEDIVDELEGVESSASLRHYIS